MRARPEKKSEGASTLFIPPELWRGDSRREEEWHRHVSGRCRAAKKMVSDVSEKSGGLKQLQQSVGSPREGPVVEQRGNRLVASIADQSGRALRQRDGAEDVLKPRVPHAHRAVRTPSGFEAHARRGLVVLNADAIENVDRRAVARIADAVALIVGADQPHAG